MAIYNEADKSKWTKDGRHWYFVVSYNDFQGNKKQYKSKKFTTKAEAEEEQSLFLLKRDNPCKKEFKLIADDYFNDYKKKRKLSSYENVIYAYNKHILPYFKDFYINDINIPIIKNWRNEIEKKGYNINYLNKIRIILKNIIDFAIINYGLANNPVTILGSFEVKKDKIIKDEEKLRYITLEDFKKFISFVDNELYKMFFIFLFYTGCRKGEVLALNWGDIDFKNNIISITKTLYYKHGKSELTSTKTGQNRKIKMSKTLKDSLIEYKQIVMQYKDFKENWFVFGNSRFLPPTTIDRYKAKYFEKANMQDKEITIHEFRHSHVSLLINEYIKNNQTDTKKFFIMLSSRMGHTIEVMENTYMHLFPTIQDDIINLLDNL